ncbi:hypothetical protein UPYG_G00225890 [Umbra pygmaea]|uniref:USP domain-containing protein n=1 Tax=Umbra pygmaea TaxID=75934 RepID=A0ABD0WE51_UMBPY
MVLIGHNDFSWIRVSLQLATDMDSSRKKKVLLEKRENTSSSAPCPTAGVGKEKAVTVRQKGFFFWCRKKKIVPEKRAKTSSPAPCSGVTKEKAVNTVGLKGFFSWCRKKKIVPEKRGKTSSPAPCSGVTKEKAVNTVGLKSFFSWCTKKKIVPEKRGKTSSPAPCSGVTKVKAVNKVGLKGFFSCCRKTCPAELPSNPASPPKHPSPVLRGGGALTSPNPLGHYGEKSRRVVTFSITEGREPHSSLCPSAPSTDPGVVPIFFEKLIDNCSSVTSTLWCLLSLPHFLMDILQQKEMWNTSPFSILLHCLSQVAYLCRADQASKKELILKMKYRLIDLDNNILTATHKDAHELLVQLLCQLKEEGLALRKQGLSYSCPVSQLEFKISSVITCTNCGSELSNSEEYNHLSLDLSPEGTLLDSLALNFKCQKVEFRCAFCQGHHALKKDQFHTLPRVLVLHLKRFGGPGGAEKLETPLFIPPNLSLSTLCGDTVPPLHSIVPEDFTNQDASTSEKGLQFR